MIATTGKHPSRKFAKGLLLWTVAHHSPSKCDAFGSRNSNIFLYSFSPSVVGRRRRHQGTWAKSKSQSRTFVQSPDSYSSDQFIVSTHSSSRSLSSGIDTGNNHDDTHNLSPLAQAIQESIDGVLLQIRSTNEGTVSGDAHKKQVVITLSVSGGCDSVAMLHACMEWLRFGSRSHVATTTTTTLVQVVHFNHQQRGTESDHDAIFVQDLCRNYNLPCHVELWKDHREGASSSSSSRGPTFSQDVAREWRRQRLFSLTQQAMDDWSNSNSESDGRGSECVGVILTAHHQDDSMESLLLKALRGVHLLNLSGMTPQTRLSSSMVLLRPWIQDFEKQDLINYLQQHHWTWREDESNTSSKYLRNRVRQELIPLLQDLTDQAFIATRLPTWIQQSQELAQDLQPRIDALSHQVVIGCRGGGVNDDNDDDDDDDCENDHDYDYYFEWEKSCRLVESTNDPSITPLVQSQTLYQWMTTQHHASSQVSYETFQRVLDQLQKYPHNHEWILELGKGCKIQRQGAILRIRKPTPTITTTTTSNPSAANKKQPMTWSWSILSKEELDSVQQANVEISKNQKFPFRWSKQEMILWIPKDWMVPPVSFYQMTLAQYEQERQTRTPQSNHNHKNKKTSLMFRPPWKSKSSSSTTKTTPVKLRQFLRGQGVPLHQRDHVHLLIAKNSIVAVQFHRDDLREWIVNGDYYYQGGNIPQDCIPIRLHCKNRRSS